MEFLSGVFSRYDRHIHHLHTLDNAYRYSQLPVTVMQHT